MNIPVFELKRQFQQIKGEINKTIKEVLNSGFYILGKNVKIIGRLKFKIRGGYNNIIIKNGCVINEEVELRNRENGKIIIGENVAIDSKVRLVAAKEGYLKIGPGTSIGTGTIINAGSSLDIGEFVIIGAYVSIDASKHNYEKNK